MKFTKRNHIKGNDCNIYRECKRLNLNSHTIRMFRVHEEIMRRIRETVKDLNVNNPYIDTVEELEKLSISAKFVCEMLTVELESLKPGTLEYKTIRGAVVAMKNAPKRIQKWFDAHPEIFEKEVVPFGVVVIDETQEKQESEKIERTEKIEKAESIMREEIEILSEALNDDYNADDVADIEEALQVVREAVEIVEKLGGDATDGHQFIRNVEKMIMILMDNEVERLNGCEALEKVA